MTEFSDRYYTSFDGLKLHYRDYAGPAQPRHTVLCLHGLTRNARDFEALALHLAQWNRVLVIDFRGRGESENATDPMTYVPPVYVQDVKALLDAANVTEAVFIGTSLGGLVTMISANVIRHRVKAAVLNDIGPDLGAEGMARIATYVASDPAFTSWDECVAELIRLNTHVFPDWTEDQWLVMAKRLCRMHDDGTIHTDYDNQLAVPFMQLDPEKPVDLWPYFEALKGIPALSIRGGTSDLFSEETFAKMKTVYPALRQATVPGVGHAPYLLEPEAIGAIEALLRDVPAKTGLIKRIVKRITAIYFFFRAVNLAKNAA